MKFNFLLYTLILNQCIAANAQENCKPPLSNLSEDTVLKTNCIYNSSFKITRSLALDCQGSTLDGKGLLKNGIVIDSLGLPLSKIAIKNCNIKNFTNTGISIGWSAWDDEKLKFTKNEIYEKTPKQIIIKNTTIDTVGTVGIYIDDYVSQVEIEESRIANAFGVGVYMEHSSRNNSIVNSVIENNGKKWSNVSWQPGVSIDSSAYNKISNNLFSNNGKSGISLYRNCQENKDENPHSVLRWQGASENKLTNNTFTNEDIGVWIGERMSRNLASMKCGMLPYFSANGTIYIQDDAKKNIVSNNKFNQIKRHAIIVEDDFNEIMDNHIYNQNTPGIVVGAPIRAKAIGMPVRGTVIQGNTVNGHPASVIFTDKQ